MSKDRKREALTVTETEGLDSRSAPALTSEEERALRMRTGKRLATDVPLPLKAEAGTAAATALLEMEARLLDRVRRHQAGLEVDEEILPESDAAQPRDSATKSKIVRALRKKH